MSWGYWGIVTALLLLLTVFFFCVDLLYRDQKKRVADAAQSDLHETTQATGAKHAA